MLATSLAHFPFQVIQLLTPFVIPQILQRDFFDLVAAPKWPRALSRYLPLTRGVRALQPVMPHGADLLDVLSDLGAECGFSRIIRPFRARPQENARNGKLIAMACV